MKFKISHREMSTMGGKRFTRLEFLKLGASGMAALPLAGSARGETGKKEDKSSSGSEQTASGSILKNKRPPGPYYREHMGRQACEESGAEIVQLTSTPMIHEHIYPESPIFTPDSRFFVYLRRASLDQPKEYWLCEVTRSWRLYRLTDEKPVEGPVISPDGEYFYYIWERAENEVVLVRRHLWSGEREELVAARGVHSPDNKGTISPDGRYYAIRVMTPDWTASIIRFDTEKRDWRIIHSNREIFNAHPQWEPGQGKYILIQHNRGGQIDRDGNYLSWLGPQGATLYLIDSISGIMHPLAIGKPHTPGVQGHQCWLGNTGKVLATLVKNIEVHDRTGNLVTVAKGDEAPRVVAGGRWFWHVAASVDGRFFICDESSTGNIYVGSVKTGKSRLLCPSNTIFGAPQYTHPHPFLSPDCRYAFFNSTRSGSAHIYSASIPEGFLESLES